MRLCTELPKLLPSMIKIGMLATPESSPVFRCVRFPADGRQARQPQEAGIERIIPSAMCAVESVRTPPIHPPSVLARLSLSRNFLASWVGKGRRRETARFRGCRCVLKKLPSYVESGWDYPLRQSPSLRASPSLSGRERHLCSRAPTSSH